MFPYIDSSPVVGGRNKFLVGFVSLSLSMMLVCLGIKEKQRKRVLPDKSRATRYGPTGPIRRRTIRYIVGEKSGASFVFSLGQNNTNGYFLDDKMNDAYDRVEDSLGKIFQNAELTNCRSKAPSGE